MDEKKEVQQTIIPRSNNKKVSEEDFFNVLRTIAPGTNFRAGLDGILKAKRGALVVLENEDIPAIIDGGFRVGCKFTPQRLVELSKMDGAIILSKDIKKISYANVLLTPDNKIKSSETGARHKAAERTAKQARCLVIAVSERKGEITLFYEDMRYLIKDTNELLRKVNEHMQLLERQRDLFYSHLEVLNELELRDNLNSRQAINIVQRGKLMQKIAKEIRKNLVELGNEGILLRTRFRELMKDVEKETNFIIKDYTKLNLKKSRVLLDSLSYEELNDENNIFKSLGYFENRRIDSLRGWRLLSETSLSDEEIAKLMKELGDFKKINESDISSFKKILGDERAKIFKEELVQVRKNYSD